MNLLRRLLKGLYREILIPVSLTLVVIFFVIQAFKIPSGSMEDTLLVGDFLLGLKFVYGSPIPFSDKRLPALQEPTPGDIVIFRFPGEPEYPDYNPQRYAHISNLLMFGNLYWDRTPEQGQSRLVHFPTGPKDFIKRCVATSGQTVELRQGLLKVDGKALDLPGFGKFQSMLRNQTPRDEFGPLRIPAPGDTLRFAELGVKELQFARSLAMQENPQSRFELEIQLLGPEGQPEEAFLFEKFRVPLEQHKGMLANVILDQLDPMERNHLRIGDTVQARLPFRFFSELARTGFIAHPDPQPNSWMRTIAYDMFEPTQLEDLEHNVAQLNAARTVQGSMGQYRLQYRVLRDGSPLEEYVVRDRAYFMMGDNRDNSQDSRFWGYVAHRNIKAKAFIIYFSFDNADESFAFTNPLSWVGIPLQIRWTRFGKLIHDIGASWE